MSAERPPSRLEARPDLTRLRKMAEMVDQTDVLFLLDELERTERELRDLSITFAAMVYELGGRVIVSDLSLMKVNAGTLDRMRQFDPSGEVFTVRGLGVPDA